ncbi:lysylphosphatidylglycerol synthase domain-containing protein [Clostridium aestuarii]|uniref:lysylphosphatidylglycerol synthase domain-containing protein n=1 Tax=Clostridium aestuarii TaxID=338193 RepID=UPI00227A713D|nr:lysylphosphatidylglycerol synthase domain-containing protein [Clostridium aestuarii]
MITLICFIFIVKMILSVNIDWNIINNREQKWVLIILLSVLSAGSLYLVAYGWSILVKFIETKDIKNNILIFIYIKSNIAKYLPGNIMNLVGRNVLAGKLGFKQISIATSTVMEIIIFGCTTMMLSFLFSITKLKDVFNLIQKYIDYKFIVVIILVCSLLIIFMIVYMINNKNQCIKEIKKYVTTSFLKLSIKLVFLYSIYFIFSGIMLGIVLKNILNVSIGFVDFFQIIGIYIISFFVGYITPGAPGGMGVREAVLIVLLTNVIGSDLATIASIIHRLITIIADIIIYGIGYFYIRKA